MSAADEAGTRDSLSSVSGPFHIIVGELASPSEPGARVLCIPSPLRTADLRDALQRIIAQLRASDPYPPASPSVRATQSPAPTSTHHDAGLHSPEAPKPLQFLAGLPKQGAIRLRHEGKVLILDYDECTLWAPADANLRDFAERALESQQYAPVHDGDLNMSTQGQYAHSLYRFLWTQALRYSNGGLLPRIRWASGLRLTRYPMFDRVERRDWMQPIALKLMRGNTSLRQLLGHPDADRRSQTIAFLNACELCGWLDTSGEPATTYRERFGVSPKIVVTGPMGSGKTTAIASVAGRFKGVEAAASDADTRGRKPSTTIAYDYGELDLPTLGPVRLYGTPGQRRFSFMWNIISRGARGYVVLVDNARRLPLSDLGTYLDTFGEKLRRTGAVIGVTRLDEQGKPSLADYDRYLAERGEEIPVLGVDARDGTQVLDVLDALILNDGTRAA
ncbi:MAG: GTP-binding protein [Gammaproteobacteria bacterium]